MGCPETIESTSSFAADKVWAALLAKPERSHGHRHVGLKRRALILLDDGCTPPRTDHCRSFHAAVELQFLVPARKVTQVGVRPSGGNSRLCRLCDSKVSPLRPRFMLTRSNGCSAGAWAFQPTLAASVSCSSPTLRANCRAAKRMTQGARSGHT